MDHDSGLVCAFLMDGQGGGQPLDWIGVKTWTPDQGNLWVHLDRTVDRTRSWLAEESGLDPLVCDALMAEDTRPRVAHFESGLIVILRGVNLNPGADPEDMVSIRLWIDNERVISLRLRRLMAVEDIRKRLAAGRGPAGPSDLLVDLARGLVERTAPVVDDFEDLADELEDTVVEVSSRELRSQVAALRRKVIALRRHLAPQREVMAVLMNERTEWLDDLHRLRLREVADRIIRHVEDLDAVRDRAAVVQDELTGRLGEQMNRNMYVLSIVAGIFLPLGLLTGLLGINVGGIPGANTPWAFAAVCFLLVAFGVGEIWILRRLRWF